MALSWLAYISNSPLSHLVTHIIGLRSEEEMVGIYTARHVTTMKDG